jgi:hypothetical protein
MTNPLNATFLNEPAYRWFFFVGLMIFALAAWGDVLRFMKKAAEA